MLSERLFKDGVLTIDVAHKVLSPHYGDIWLPIYEGINNTEELLKREPEYCKPLKSRSWANMVYDQIELAATRIFANKGPDVTVCTDNGFLIIDFYGHIYIRYKKLQHNLLPCNIETEQQRAFDEQMLFRGAVTHLTAGYRLDELRMYKDAHIVCVEHHKVLWSLRLPEKEQQSKEIMDKPIAPVQKTYVIGRNKKTNKAKTTAKQA